MGQSSGAVSATPSPVVAGALKPRVLARGAVNLEVLVMAVGPLLNHTPGEIKYRAKFSARPPPFGFQLDFQGICRLVLET